MDKLTEEEFRAPGPEYRSAPFWAWNCRVDRKLIDSQLEVFRRMGMGGAHIHPRTGMATEYLSGEFMELVRFAAERAGELGLRIFLYDEDRWPSGSAGGKVTEDPRYAAKYLIFTWTPYGEYSGRTRWAPDELHGNGAVRQENGRLLYLYDVELDGGGRLAGYRRIREPSEALCRCLYVYLEPSPVSAWMNNRQYADVMSQEAVGRFRDLTYEPYRQALGDLFGKTVPSIFTDEPQFAAMKGVLSEPFSGSDVFLPWTEGIEEDVRRRHGLELADSLPELLWERADGALSRARYCYHDATAELFAVSYCGTLGDWCRENGIIFTGHLMLEPTLFSQTSKIGEAMRCYRYFRELPGIDMLCSEFEYNTAKQCQSVSRQLGGRGMASELYGATGWDSDFRKYKLLGDWQAALGVTLRVPHLCWMSMEGEAKRDYPGSLFFQSPWYEKAPYLEDHFARINTAMTRGRPVVRVGVIHPIESFWAAFGPESQTGQLREKMDREFDRLTRALLFGLIDFDFISEANIPWYSRQGGAPGEAMYMSYHTVIVPELLTIRGTTLEWLRDFRDRGGRIILTGKSPEYVDAMPSMLAREFFAGCQTVGAGAEDVLSALEPERLLDIRVADPGKVLMRQRMSLPRPGSRTDFLIYQLREDKCGERWLFIANGRPPGLAAADPEMTVEISLRGTWRVMCMDTLTGGIRELPVRQSGGLTVFRRIWHIHDSLLLHLEPGEAVETREDRPMAPGKPLPVPDSVSFTLSEPNVCLLDRAAYGFDGCQWAGEGQEEDILRIDNICRDRMGLPRRKKLVVQPYADRSEAEPVTVFLRFRVESLIPAADVKLAGEVGHVSGLLLNGKPVPIEPDGHFVDGSIKTIPLPPLTVGVNELIIRQEIGPRSGLESFFLLGSFGVELRGRELRLVPMPEKVAFGNLVYQGFPFYTGNITYRIPVDGSGGVLVRAPHYHGALIEAALGDYSEIIAFSPYAAHLPPSESRELRLTLYGNRHNAFGQLHFTPGVPYYPSPDSWRSEGDLWMDEYQPVEFGILGRPEVRRAEKGANIVKNGGTI